MHYFPKPTGGGIWFSSIISFLSLLNGFYLPLFSLPLSVISLVDDKYNLKRSIRYISQVLFILFIYLYLSFKNQLFINNYSNSLVNFFIIIFCIFIGTAIINFINFMDGIDGLVGGCFITIFFIISISDNSNFLIAFSSLVAFIIFNWHPSKIFMGDSGSIFLGSLVVSYALSQENYYESSKLIFLLSPLLLDATICIFRRLKNKQNILKPHKLHLYQRLVSNGFKHSSVSLIYIMSTIFLGLIYSFLNFYLLVLGTFLILFLGFYLDWKYAAQFQIN